MNQQCEFLKGGHFGESNFYASPAFTGNVEYTDMHLIAFLPWCFNKFHHGTFVSVERISNNLHSGKQTSDPVAVSCSDT